MLLDETLAKMSSLIQVVLKHFIGKEITRDQFPNASTSQTIFDEGHFIAKSFISEKLEKCENWGLGCIGTTRKNGRY